MNTLAKVEDEFPSSGRSIISPGSPQTLVASYIICTVFCPSYEYSYHLHTTKVSSPHWLYDHPAIKPNQPAGNLPRRPRKRVGAPRLTSNGVVNNHTWVHLHVINSATCNRSVLIAEHFPALLLPAFLPLLPCWLYKLYLTTSDSHIWWIASLLSFHLCSYLGDKIFF